MESRAPSSTTQLQGVVFDAYGTLFDVYSIGALAEQNFPGRGTELARMWRDKQIEYTRIRTLSDRYAPFSRVTRDALRYACAAVGCALSDAVEDALMSAYGRLPLFADAHASLQGLRALGLPTAILSNGDPEMLSAVVHANGIAGMLDHVVSVDAVRRFKTAPEAYALAPRALNCSARELLFVSSNGWDACGATWFGYRTIWVNRQGLPLEELDVTAYRQVRALGEVVAIAEDIVSAADRSDAASPPRAGPSSEERADRAFSQPPSIHH